MSTEYDWLGRTTSTTDQRGVVHEFSYDFAGRLSADTVTSLGTTGLVDDSVLAIGTTYDDIGRVLSVTSYSDTSGTAPVNEVKYEYNGWGKVYREYQEHDGAVDANSLFVQYDYADGATGGVAKYVRLEQVTYPNGREVHYGYGTAGAVEDIMSRLAAIGDGASTQAAYSYLGADKIVTEDYVEAQVKLDYAHDNLAGFDRFGRVVDQLWTDYGSDPDVTLDHYTYTYDRAGNRVSRANALNPDLDETYGYDALDRLTEWSLDGVIQETWSLDSLGNNLAAGTYNAANEETPTSGSSGYDAAGNMTTLQSGKTAVYDAWNRLVEVDDSETVVERHEYDGTNRRIQIFSDFDGSTPDEVQYDYHSSQQVIESDVTTDGARNGGYQTIWSPRYIDAPILRDTLNAAGTGIVTASRVFYLADANYNVTGLAKYDSGTSKWQTAERYSYTPYGVVAYRDADWSVAASSANGNTTLYTGRVLDVATGLHYYRARYYDAGLERFINRDPIGYRGGMNVYEYVTDNPVNRIDPKGLWGSGTSGHGGFPTGGNCFDYERYDDELSTSPWPFVGNPSGHFQPLNESNIQAAVSSCDPRAFENALHQMQDYFSHYGQGYEWPSWGLGHGIASVWPWGPEPDSVADYPASYGEAKRRTQYWVDRWNSCCNKATCGDDNPGTKCPRPDDCDNTPAPPPPFTTPPRTTSPEPPPFQYPPGYNGGMFPPGMFQ